MEGEVAAFGRAGVGGGGAACARDGGGRLPAGAAAGAGGQGTVYRASRGGRLYALKFLSLDSPDWAWRELEVRLRLRLRRVGGLAVECHGLWPHEAPRYLYLVTPLTAGRRPGGAGLETPGLLPVWQ
ncbi:hypothetical protein KYC5002_42385 [Archangium violaceum]|uniref:hypothetical protein n=1 Tax=Archangium violaceum TaxID=83451 RepID=UPI002B2E04F5|nr:hypothetical protein KYC5002_42385 [Archangium gephyra]